MTITANEAATIAAIVQIATDYRTNPLNYLDTSEEISFNSGYGGGANVRIKSLRSVLRDKGVDFEFLGYGCFGTVFAVSDDKVLKILHREDKSYVAYATYCQAVSNPLLPVVYEMGKLGETEYYYFVLERLEAFCDYNDDMVLQYKIISHYFTNNCAYGIHFMLNSDIKSAIDDIKNLRKTSDAHMHSDLHSGNVMFRRVKLADESDFYYQAVITDPYS